MAARMVNAIPTANTNLAGFVATVPLHCKQSRPLGRIVRADSAEMCELLHTSPLVQKMMGSRRVTRDSRSQLPRPSHCHSLRLLQPQAAFRRRRHQPRRPPLAKLPPILKGVGHVYEAAHLYLLLKKKMSGQERITRIHSRNPSAPG